MKTIIYTLLSFVITFLCIKPVTGQNVEHTECGTTFSPEEMEHFRKTRKARQDFKLQLDIKDNKEGNSLINRALKFVPINANIYKDEMGNGGITDDQLNIAMDDLNILYANAGIKFFLCSISYNYGSGQFDFSLANNAAIDIYDKPDVINAHFFNSITSSNGMISYSGFRPNIPDRFYMTNNATLNGTTFAHELGHYFSLFHTHGKFDCGGTPDELADGSNCETAGDDVCDTPADPILGCGSGNVNAACNYVGTALDANGDPYNPLTNNIMSYAPAVCRTSFTQGQLNRIAFSLQNDHTNLGTASSMTLSTDDVVNNGQTKKYKAGYEINFTPGFDAKSGADIFAHITCVIVDQDADAIIDPDMNLHIVSKEETEKILTHTYPNPFTSSIQFKYKVKSASPVTLVIYNLQGRKIATPFEGVIKETGEHIFEFNGSKLKAGMYLYKIQIGNEVFSGKIMKEK